MRECIGKRRMKCTLKKQFAKYDFLLNAVADALSEMKTVPGETALSLADRIEEMLKEKFDKLGNRDSGC